MSPTNNGPGTPAKAPTGPGRGADPDALKVGASAGAVKGGAPRFAISQEVPEIQVFPGESLRVAFVTEKGEVAHVHLEWAEHPFEKLEPTVFLDDDDVWVDPLDEHPDEYDGPDEIDYDATTARERYLADAAEKRRLG